jgi:very-short-patch-repair endonuclease
LSDIEDAVYDLLKETFPNFKIERQFYIKIDYQKLFFDFKIDPIKVLIEVQGEQHFEFSKFFHGNKKQFRKHSSRDKLKKKWALDNGYSLIEFDKDTIPASREELVSLIYSIKMEG